MKTHKRWTCYIQLGNHIVILGDNLDSHSIIILKIIVPLNTSAVTARNLEIIGY